MIMVSLHYLYYIVLKYTGGSVDLLGVRYRDVSQHIVIKRCT